MSNISKHSLFYYPRSDRVAYPSVASWTKILAVVVCYFARCTRAAAACKDSTTWTRTVSNGREQLCGWVNAKPALRCNRRGNTDADMRLAREACPLACGSCITLPPPNACIDQSSWSWINRKGNPKGCHWVAMKPIRRCSFLGSNNGVDTWAYEGCPESCDRCPAEYRYDNNVPDNKVCSDYGSLVGPNIEIVADGIATRKLSFVAIGDTPYDANVGEVPYEGAEYKCLRDVILPQLSENEPQFGGKYSDFMVHVGDIWKGNGRGGVPYCNAQMFHSRQSLFQALEPHLDFFAVPGDNEWNECANYQGTRDPSSSSAEELWRRSFANPEVSPFARFDRTTLLPTSNMTTPTVHRHLPHYPEIFFFTYLEVAFFGVLETMGHDAVDSHSTYINYGGDINAYWIDTQLAQLSSPPSAIVVFGHSRFSNQVKSVLMAQGSTIPILYVTGNTHPEHYCLKYDQQFSSNVLQLTVEPFRAGPLLVSIEVDHFGKHFFHVEQVGGC